MAYIFWPTNLDQIDRLKIEPGTEHVIIISHGVRDDATTWSDGLKQALTTADDNEQIVSLNWHPYAQSPFRCSVNGRRLGETLGRLLASQENLRSLHLIAHSCGSFVSLGICQTVKAHRNDVIVQSTYLDPVTVYGGVFWNYGVTRFGSCADFSDAYIDTEDTVPGSNQLLPLTYTFDVTPARKRAGFAGSPHVWPTVYYLRRAQDRTTLDLRADPLVSTRYPRNALEPLSGY
jgi:hypothetical protein